MCIVTEVEGQGMGCVWELSGKGWRGEEAFCLYCIALESLEFWKHDWSDDDVELSIGKPYQATVLTEGV